jgi:hypothetical protein
MPLHPIKIRPGHKRVKGHEHRTKCVYEDDDADYVAHDMAVSINGWASQNALAAVFAVRRASLDHTVGAGEQHWRNVDAKRFGVLSLSLATKRVDTVVVGSGIARSAA